MRSDRRPTRGHPAGRDVPRTARRIRPVPPAAPAPRERFLATDPYRANREWARYEGTPQRDLFRELRRRFLARWAVADGWAIDVGSGPGRFTPFLGGGPSRRVAFDLSPAMLRRVPAPGTATADGPYPEVHRVRGDALRPPFSADGFAEVASVGNTLGFAGADVARMLDSVEALVAPGGTLVVELAPGPGERSGYLHRLPASSVARLLRVPPAALVPRILRGPFLPETVRHRPEGFERLRAPALHDRWLARGWQLLETAAIAPCLGADPERIARVRSDPKAWDHLLAVEEAVGRDPGRWGTAAAVLTAVRRSLRGHD